MSKVSSLFISEHGMDSPPKHSHYNVYIGASQEESIADVLSVSPSSPGVLPHLPTQSTQFSSCVSQVHQALLPDGPRRLLCAVHGSCGRRDEKEHGWYPFRPACSTVLYPSPPGRFKTVMNILLTFHVPWFTNLIYHI